METTLATVPTIEAAPEAAKKKKSRGQRGMGNVYVHRKNYWLDVRANGQRHRVKLGPVKVLEKREARAIADGKITGLLMPKQDEKGQVPFREFAAKFAAWALETKLGWERYRGKKLEKTPLRRAVKFFGDTPLKNITKDHIKDFGIFLAQRRIGGRPVKNRTVNGDLRDLRHVFNKAIEWNAADNNPVSKFKFADEERQKSAGRILETDAEQAKLLAALPAWLRLMVEFDLQTGARRGDLLKLTWKQVHPDYVEFLETKECKHREVSLSSRAQEILALLRSPGVSPNAWVFEPYVERETLKSRVRREWARALKVSGVAKIRLHDMRHTVLTRLVRDGVDLRTVQDIAGHAKLSTTERYLHSSDKLKQAAVEKLAEYGRCLPSASAEPASETVVTDSRIN